MRAQLKQNNNGPNQTEGEDVLEVDLGIGLKKITGCFELICNGIMNLMEFSR